MSQAALALPTTGTLSGLSEVNDINGAVDAVNTDNSGSAAPTNQLSGSPSAGNRWLDTTVAASLKRKFFDGNLWLLEGFVDTINDIWQPILGGGSGTLAAASTVDLGSVPQSFVTIIGTSGSIASFGSSATVGSFKGGRFASAGAVIVAGANMIVPGGVNITAQAGDTFIAWQMASGQWVVFYQRASGATFSAAVPTPWEITGGLPTSITGSATTASIAVSAAICADATAAVRMNYAGGTFAAANGNAINGCADGTTLQNSVTYHVYLCQGASGMGLYASRTAPGSFSPSSAPSGYQSYARRLFSFMTTGAGAPVPFTSDEIAGGAIQAWLTTAVEDINVGLNASYATARALFTMSVPQGIKVKWQGRISAAANGYSIYSSPDEPDVAPATSVTAYPGYDQYFNGYWNMQKDLITNTNGQICARGSASGMNWYAETIGWVDFRRS